MKSSSTWSGVIVIVQSNLLDKHSGCLVNVCMLKITLMIKSTKVIKKAISLRLLIKII